ncbi:MAG: DUF2232 domain-containing protein [Candidatus Eisenbacteria bacterium]
MVPVLMLLVVGSATTPWPWDALWIAVPVLVCVALLLSWRYGRPAIAFPVALLLVAIALQMSVGKPFSPWFTWWAPAAAFTGAWMGLREEGGGPGSGYRAWMLAPLLLLAASMPWFPGYSGFLGRITEAQKPAQSWMYTELQKAGWNPTQVQEIEKSNREALPVLIPAALFIWMALLVSAGRALAARSAGALGWPRLSRNPFRDWRLPDLALVPLIAGLALILFAPLSWHPTAGTLLLQAMLGYSLQGVAAITALLSSRGMPLGLVVMMLSILFILTMPVFLLSVAFVGLSDAWFDYRRLESSPNGEA